MLFASFQGKVIYDQSFSKYFSILQTNTSLIADLCRICTKIGSNSQLVKANSSRCLPLHPGSASEFSDFIALFKFYFTYILA